jgi:hypothetical protein
MLLKLFEIKNTSGKTTERQEVFVGAMSIIPL